MQAGLNLCWTHMSEGTFSLNAAQFIFALSSLAQAYFCTWKDRIVCENFKLPRFCLHFNCKQFISMSVQINSNHDFNLAIVISCTNHMYLTRGCQNVCYCLLLYNAYHHENIPI